MKAMMALSLMMLLTACVPKKDLEAMMGERDALELRLTERETELADRTSEGRRLKNELSAAEDALSQLNRKLATKVAETGALKQNIEGMQSALSEAERRKENADEMLNSYRDLVARFQKLIDAGTLKVKVIDGRMVVEMATDILFPAGSATLSRDGREAVKQVSQILAEIPDREFQVAGHTDNVPIGTERFPSNWHLGAARSISVTRLLVDSGVEGNRVSAASFADYRPADTNRTREGRANNRRIEIIIVPDLSQLPGFDDFEGLVDRAE